MIRVAPRGEQEQDKGNEPHTVNHEWEIKGSRQHGKRQSHPGTGFLQANDREGGSPLAQAHFAGGLFRWCRDEEDGGLDI
jgi:hypothetical protein